MTKIKNFMILIASLFLLSYCNNKNLYDEESNDNTMPNSMQELKVDVPTGKYAVLLFGGDTLAVCTESTTIMAPNVSASTVSKSSSRAYGANDITINYLDATGSSNKIENKQQVFQVVAFEDSKVGDYDYNDLIFHAKIYHKGNERSIFFDPIAMGAKKNIALGCVITMSNGTPWDNIIFDNTRAELFDGREGYINTLAGQELYKYETAKKIILPSTLKGDIKSVDWYINVDKNQKLFAVSNNYKYSDDNNRPFGLVFTSINKNYYYNYVPGYKTACGSDWWNYPAENHSIDEVYYFTETFWTKQSSDFTIFSTQDKNNIKSENYIKAIVVDENNEDKENKSLYSINFNHYTLYKQY